MKKIFSRHGIPKVVFSDNGPQYPSQQFRSFAKSWDFNHLTSSPNHPQSNGLAERNVQTVKRLLKKSSEGGTDPYIALLTFNTTPSVSGNSPAFLLMKRIPRTTLPSIVTEELKHKTDKSTRQCGRNLPEIPPSTIVLHNTTIPPIHFSIFVQQNSLLYVYTTKVVDLWPSGLRCRTRDPTVVSSNPALGHQC